MEISFQSIIDSTLTFFDTWCFPIGMVVGVLGVLMFGKNYKERIAVLEEKVKEPKQINNTKIDICLYPDKKTRKALEETMDKLGRNDLGNGNEYSPLPDYSNLVSLADGSYRIGMPIEVKLEPVVMKLDASAKVETINPDDSNPD